jgi:hypothetical protein
MFDTGSSWLVIENKQCSNCLNNTWDHTKSVTHKRVDDDYMEHRHGDALLYGYDAKDMISMDIGGRTRINSFEFFEIYA